LNSLHGVFGIQQLPYLASVVLSVLIITFIVNAFNLIDGIDGLAAALGIMANGTFAILFFYLHQYQLAIVACAMAGAIIGFMRFNLTPAKIFMGDTGSLLIGLISSILAIKFIETSNFSTDSLPRVNSAPALTFAILIVPIFDTLRVFTLRILKGKSPFTADRNHVHHRLLELGLNHLQATILLVGINIIFLVLVVTLGEYGSNTMLIVTIATTSMLLNWLLTFLIRAKNTQTYSLAHLSAVTINKKQY
jgi:UDP-N-acetylmuramyl pentapeptide phosphotransferase/UDP-N-acetylglucosamine-1-phosphate transferase